MTSKIISIKKSIYDKLKLLKGEEKSFSDVIEELLSERKKDPLAHFGIGKDFSEKEQEIFEKSIEDSRKEQRRLYKKKHSLMINDDNC